MSIEKTMLFMPVIRNKTPLKLAMACCADETPSSLAQKYPDLEPKELDFVEKYLRAFEKSFLHPYEFDQARVKLCERVDALYRQYRQEKIKDRRLKILAKIINLVTLAKSTDAINILSNYQQAGTSELDLPEKIKNLLAIKIGNRSGMTYLDYVKKHVRDVFFVPRLVDYRKISDEGRNRKGAVEELTRSVIVDTEDECFLGSIITPDEMLASTLVHEAAHIEFFENTRMNPQDFFATASEKFAYTAEARFLKELLTEKTDAERAERIEKRLIFIQEELKKIRP